MFKAAAIFGQPVSHSRSPLVHGTWLHEHKISGAYFREEVSPQDLHGRLQRLQDSGLVGASLTLPLKEAACAHVELDDIAAKLQAVNTVWLEHGKVHGTNTDAPGFTAACDGQAPQWRNALGHVVVLGAGGAAKAVVYALQDAGAERITLINRTKSRADGLSALFGAKVKSEDWDALYNIVPQAGMLVNTTSLGMKGQPALEFDVKKLKSGAIVADIVYAPLTTVLLQEARREGHQTVDGLGMLLNQAVPAFERWFGIKPKVTKELRALIEADLQA